MGDLRATLMLFAIAVLFRHANVLAADSADSAPEVQNYLQVNLSADRNDAHTNEQVLLTLRVAAPASAFNITGDKLEIAKGNLSTIHKSKYEKTFNGIPYRFVETRYALFVQQPGTVTIDSLDFSAVLPTSFKANDGTTKSSPNPTLTAKSHALVIHISNPPSSDQQSAQSWLPATQLTLRSSWAKSSDGLAGERVAGLVGEPLTRTVTASIEGQHPSALPEFFTVSANDLRIYPASAELTVKKTPNGLNGEKKQSFDIIMPRDGLFELPALSIDWWDINQQRWKTATLASEVIEASPVFSPASQEAQLTQPAGKQKRSSPLSAISITAIFAALVPTLVLVVWLPRRAAHRPRYQNQRRAHTRAFERAIKSNKLDVVRAALLTWARSFWPDRKISRLDQLASVVNDDDQVLHKLDEALYRERPGAFPTQTELKRLFNNIRKNPERRQDTPNSRYRDLYPRQ